METFDIKYAKEHLEELLDRAAKGEDVSIEAPQLGTFALSPRSPMRKSRTRPILGQWKDRLIVPARLFEPLSEDELAWLSGETSP